MDNLELMDKFEFEIKLRIEGYNLNYIFIIYWKIYVNLEYC